MSQQSNSEMWWRRTTATLLGVSFGTYIRRRRHVPMRRRGYVSLRRIGDVLLRRLWVFHLRLIWDVVGRTDGTSSLSFLETLWRSTTDTSWPRSTETSLGISFEMYLRRLWDVQRDLATTSPQRLVARWGRAKTCE